MGGGVYFFGGGIRKPLKRAILNTQGLHAALTMCLGFLSFWTVPVLLAASSRIDLRIASSCACSTCCGDRGWELCTQKAHGLLLSIVWLSNSPTATTLCSSKWQAMAVTAPALRTSSRTGTISFNLCKCSNLCIQIWCQMVTLSRHHSYSHIFPLSDSPQISLAASKQWLPFVTHFLPRDKAKVYTQLYIWLRNHAIWHNSHQAAWHIPHGHITIGAVPEHHPQSPQPHGHTVA